MENSILNQLYSLLIFTLSGIIVGIFFDIFRILRRSFKTADIVTYIEDFIFWILTGIFLLFMIFVFEKGQIRSYTILGIILGFILYLFTISKYFIKINVVIIKFLKQIVTKIVKLLILPIKQLFKPISFLVINFRKRKIIKQKNI